MNLLIIKIQQINLYYIQIYVLIHSLMINHILMILHHLNMVFNVIYNFYFYQNLMLTY